MSDKASAASLCLHYGSCIDDEVSYINNKAVWRDNIKLAFFEKLLKENEGSDKNLMIKFNIMAQANVTQFANMAPKIVEHYAPQMLNTKSWEKTVCSAGIKHKDTCRDEPLEDNLNDKDYCATLAVGDTVHELLDEIANIHPNFQGLPFVIHGTFGTEMWKKLDDMYASNLTLRQGSVPTKVTPLTGAFKLLD